MKRHLRFFVSITLLALATSPLSASAPKSDLKPDSAVTWGSLPNGLRYAIMKHQEPGEPGRASRRTSLRLYVHAGSLMEQENQQGLAHFLEHMAFNGTKHFPAGEMVKYFQRLGMAFGADANAETSFDSTVYQLELPQNTDAYLDDALTLFRDYADGMLLADEQISRERGVILSEKLDRDSVDFRGMVERRKFALPDSLLPRRMPIGKEEVIRKARREDFSAFYRKWYRPERMTVVIVGPVDPSDAAAKITAKFGSMKAAAEAAPEPDMGKTGGGPGLQTKLHNEPAAENTIIVMENWRPLRRGVETIQTRQDELLEGMAALMLNRRLEKLTTGGAPRFLDAATGMEEIANALDGHRLTIVCKAENWETALSAGEQELRRALIFGFTPAEFREAKAKILRFVENEAQQAGTRRVSDLADGIVKALAERKVFTHPREDLALLKASLEKIAPQQCAEALRKGWTSDSVSIFVHGNLPIKNGDQRIKDAFLKSSQVALQPPTDDKQSAWAYADFGPAGRVVKRQEVKDLGLTLVSFANNVRLNLKPTAFEKDSTYITVSFGGGRLMAPKDKPGLAMFASQMFIVGGLEKHSFDEVNSLAAGKTATVQFAVGDEFFKLQGATNRKDLVFQLQLLCAYMTAPGFRGDRARVLGQSVDSLYEAVERDADLAIQSKLPGFLYGGDARLAFPKKDELKARTIAELKQWLAEARQASWLEIGVVGDFDPQAVTDAVAATFGALPQRAATRSDSTQQRRMPVVAASQEKRIALNSTIPKASVLIVWPTTDSRRDKAAARQCTVLATILGDRVREKVRQELGKTYTPSVSAEMSETFTDMGAVICHLTCEARESSQVGRIVAQLAAKLAAEGATSDELNRAKKPLLNEAETMRGQNGYWMSELVAEAQSVPQRLDWVRTRIADYEAVRLEVVNRLAKTYLPRDRAIIVLAAPQREPEHTARR